LKHAQLRGFAADGDDDRVRGVDRAVLELDDLAVALGADLLHAGVRLDAQAELAGVVGHLRGKLGPGDRLEPGIVFDQLRVEDLATDVLGLEEDRIHVRARRIQARGETRRAASDDDQVEISHKSSKG